MPNVNEVVKFCPFANNRIMAYTPVDSAIGTNFYKIFYDYPATARHFFIPVCSVFFCVVIKGITAYNSARLYYYIIANNTIIHDRNIGVNDAIFTNYHLVTNKGSRIYKTAFANNCTITNYF